MKKNILELLTFDLDAIWFWINEDKIDHAEGVKIQHEEKKNIEVYNTPYEITIE